MYNIILAILLKKDLYARYRASIQVPYQNIELQVILKAIDKLQETSETDLTVGLVELYLFTLGNIKDKEKILYIQILEAIGKVNVDTDFTKELLETVRVRTVAAELSEAAFLVSQGTTSKEILTDLCSRLNNPLEENTPEDEFVTVDLETLYEQTTAHSGLRWRLNTLNRMLGSLRTGDFGFIFARPETGKTTFLANEATHFASQTSQPILWLNNEEQGNKVQIRCFQAALGVTTNELMQDRATNQLRYLDYTRDNLRIYDSASIHKRQVEELCKRLNPGLVIFDQIDKLKGFTADREDLHLGNIYIWARELAKQYCPIIGVCQAAGTAEGKKWLNMDDVANAKTAKQAEADFIIGIGKSHSDDMEYIRHINICKNKLTGDKDSVPALRHGKADVRIFPEIAQYKDLI